MSESIQQITTEPKNLNIKVRLDSGLLELLENYSRDNNISKSESIRVAINGLENLKKEGDAK